MWRPSTTPYCRQSCQILISQHCNTEVRVAHICNVRKLVWQCQRTSSPTTCTLHAHTHTLSPPQPSHQLPHQLATKKSQPAATFWPTLSTSAVLHTSAMTPHPQPHHLHTACSYTHTLSITALPQVATPTCYQKVAASYDFFATPLNQCGIAARPLMLKPADEVAPEATGAQRQPLTSAADSIQLSSFLRNLAGSQQRIEEHATIAAPAAGAHAHAAASIPV